MVSSFFSSKDPSLEDEFCGHSTYWYVCTNKSSVTSMTGPEVSDGRILDLMAGRVY